MCPERHVQDPDRHRSQFEQSSKGDIYQRIAVKHNIRAAAGIQMDDAEIIRPPKVLWLTVQYLVNCIVDQDRIAPGQSFYLYEGQRSEPDRDYT